MDGETVRRLALAMPEATEQPHFERTSFRVRGKIFATMREGGAEVNLALPPDFAAGVLETESGVRPVNWGTIRGWMPVDVASVRPGLLEELIPAAWARVAPKKLAAARAPA